MTAEALVGWAMALPALAAAAIVAAGRRPLLRDLLAPLIAIALFAVALALVERVAAGARPAWVGVEMLPGLALRLEVEPLGALFACIAAGLWAASALYSSAYLRANGEAHQTRFHALFAVALFATLGVAFAGNLLTLFFFYEVLTLATYPLVTHHGDPEARAGGRVYLGWLLGTSLLLFLPAVALTWQVAGTTDFRLGGVLPADVDASLVVALATLFFFGIGKAALMPVHRWLPAAMVAPAPVSALLHAVAVVKAGVFTVIKVSVYLLGVERLAGQMPWLIAVAGFTIIAASVAALGADNLKRRLAYSTVSQLSYVVLAVAILAPLSIAGAVLHVAAHAVGKITLFFAAGAIYTASHKTEVSQLDGIGARMPWTMGAFCIGALSMIGLPPAAGFVSKWFIVAGALGEAQWLALGVIAASTLLNAAYFLPIVYRAFFRPPAPVGAPDGAHAEAPGAMLAAMAATSAATVALFLWPDPLIALAVSIAGARP
jgi:multicomponent Na+:H+ antiporter subunit D